MNILNEIMEKYNIYKYATLDFSQVCLFDVRSKERIPTNAKSVISVLFPYYNEGILKGNISAYCSVKDYHIIVKDKLNVICEELVHAFPNDEFVPFVDASPIDEVHLAASVGLGVIGKNSLLIDDTYGSFVFLSEIVTTKYFPNMKQDIKNCINCGKCIKACPGKAITEAGICVQRCASHINQKKGDLSPEELEIMKKAGLVWGCDI